MNYENCAERAFIDRAIEDCLFRIDYQYEKILILNEHSNSYLFVTTFCQLRVTAKNSERSILSAIYRNPYWNDRVRQIHFSRVCNDN